MNDTPRFYCNTMLDVWAVFTVWRTKQAVCSGHAVLKFKRGCVCRPNVAKHHQWHRPLANAARFVFRRGSRTCVINLKHCQVQRSELHFHIRGAICTIYSIHGSDPSTRWSTIHHDLTNSTLTKLESELSTETGLQPEVCVSKNSHMASMRLYKEQNLAHRLLGCLRFSVAPSQEIVVLFWL